jgi:hypothetical protein
VVQVPPHHTVRSVLWPRVETTGVSATGRGVLSVGSQPPRRVRRRAPCGCAPRAPRTTRAIACARPASDDRARDRACLCAKYRSLARC